MKASDLVYVAFSKHVVALDRTTGSLRWHWKIPQGKKYPTVLVDGDRVFVSAMGYTYCLDATTGAFLWENLLEGYGVGVASIATANGNTSNGRAAAEADELEQQAAHHAPVS